MREAEIIPNNNREDYYLSLANEYRLFPDQTIQYFPMLAEPKSKPLHISSSSAEYRKDRFKSTAETTKSRFDWPKRKFSDRIDEDGDAQMESDEEEYNDYSNSVDIEYRNYKRVRR